MSMIDSRPLTRTERRKQQTYERIKDACAALIFEMGYENLTIHAITERADVGYGTFYLYFKDKDDLVWEVLRGWGEAYEQQMDEMLKDIPFPRREYLSWVAIFQYIDQVRDLFKAMMGRTGSAVLAQRYQDMLALIHERNMRAAKYNVIIELPIEFLAQFMAGALMRLLVWWVETPNRYTPQEMAAMLFETVYHQPAPSEKDTGG
jgi:AcrR family transcriptional regulator